MSLLQLDLIEAMKQRDLGMERVLDLRSDYRNRVAAAIQYLAQDGGPFTADDLRALCGDPPPGVSANLVGALVNAAAKAGVIQMHGFAVSARVAGHGNRVFQWRGVR